MSARVALTPAARRALCCLATSAALLTAAGCGGSSSAEEETEPPVASIPVLQDTNRLTLPLDAYVLDSADIQQLNRAHSLLVSRCMERFGFSFPVSESSAPADAFRHARRYGVADLASVSVYGYRPPNPSPERGEGDSAGTDEASDPAELAVLTGRGERSINGQQIPEGGCTGEGRRALVGDQPLDDLAQRLVPEANDRSQQDSRVQSAVGRWSQCMRDAGYDYAGPLDPPGDPRFTEGPVTPEEIQVATTDVRCKQSTNLLGIWSAVEAAYQQRAIDANREALEAFRDRTEDMLRRAAATT